MRTAAPGSAYFVSTKGYQLARKCDATHLPSPIFHLRPLTHLDLAAAAAAV